MHHGVRAGVHAGAMSRCVHMGCRAHGMSREEGKKRGEAICAQRWQKPSGESPHTGRIIQEGLASGTDRGVMDVRPRGGSVSHGSSMYTESTL